MKRIITLTLFVAVAVNAFSQNTVSAGITTIKKNVTVTEAPKRTTGPVAKIGFLFGPMVYSGNEPGSGIQQDKKITGEDVGINISVGFGYQITPKFYSGAVVGLTGPTKGYGAISVPILAEIRYFLSDKAKSSWFFDAQAGYNPISLSESSKESFSKLDNANSFIVDKGLVAGVGTGWSSSKCSIKMELEYNNALSRSLNKASLIFVGFQFNYYIRFGRKY